METFCLIEQPLEQWRRLINPAYWKKLNRCVTTVTIPKYVPWNVNLGSSVIGQHLFFGKSWQHIAKCNSFDQSIPLIPPLCGRYFSYPSVPLLTSPRKPTANCETVWFRLGSVGQAFGKRFIKRCLAKDGRIRIRAFLFWVDENNDAPIRQAFHDSTWSAKPARFRWTYSSNIPRGSYLWYKYDIDICRHYRQIPHRA